MTDDKAEQLLKESGLAYGMIDKEYRPNIWMIRAVQKAADLETMMKEDIAYFQNLVDNAKIHQQLRSMSVS